MSDERWTALMRDDGLRLTQTEIGEGWHFCYDWDGLLVGPGTPELESCTCPPLNSTSRLTSTS